MHCLSEIRISGGGSWFFLREGHEGGNHHPSKDNGVGVASGDGCYTLKRRSYLWWSTYGCEGGVDREERRGWVAMGKASSRSSREWKCAFFSASALINLWMHQVILSTHLQGAWCTINKHSALQTGPICLQHPLSSLRIKFFYILICPFRISLSFLVFCAYNKWIKSRLAVYLYMIANHIISLFPKRAIDEEERNFYFKKRDGE